VLGTFDCSYYYYNYCAVFVLLSLYMLIGNSSIVESINSYLPEQIRVLGTLTVRIDVSFCLSVSYVKAFSDQCL